MKHTQLVRESAKLAAGLVAGDLLAGLWFLGSGALPQSFFGVWVTPATAWLWVGFDLVALLALVHYAWNPEALEPHASSRVLFFVVGVITGAAALVHFLRLVFGWTVVIGGWSAPMWASWAGVIIAAYISYASFHLAARRGRG